MVVRAVHAPIKHRRRDIVLHISSCTSVELLFLGENLLFDRANVGEQCLATQVDSNVRQTRKFTVRYRT